MSQERFAVSAAGLGQLNASRPPWSLVKELIQNSWDEAPEATRCDVTINPRPDDTTVISVEDDGPGFAEISHAWTLMANTPKRGDPTKRGRFNLGEKEIISLAICATIETTGTTVTFPADGGRYTTPNERRHGTLVTLTMPWSKEQAEALRLQLLRFRPPTDCGLTIDGREVPRRAPLASQEAQLRTIIQHGPGLPVTDTRRKTTIDILERAEPNAAWIYEMGIPIQATSLAYDVDVHQKVPMPPNRDTVSAGYLQDIMTETLNAMHDKMPSESFSENWVRTAIEDKRIDEKAVQTVKEHRYGAHAVMWSSDTDANMRAAEAGYQVIHPKAMSEQEREVMAAKGGLRSAKHDFGRPPENPTPDTANDIRTAFGKWIVEIGRVLGLRPSVTFVSAPDGQFIAQCSMSPRNPEITINTSFCPDEWLARREAEQLELIIHELAHALSDTPMEHGPKWGDACASAGAQIADAIARKRLRYDLGPAPVSTPAIGAIGKRRTGANADAPTAQPARQARPRPG